MNSRKSARSTVHDISVLAFYEIPYFFNVLARVAGDRTGENRVTFGRVTLVCCRFVTLTEPISVSIPLYHPSFPIPRGPLMVIVP